MLVSSTGGSLVWPFLSIYARQQLDIPLTTVGLLLTCNSIGALTATLFAGPVADRVGRKGVMVLSLFASTAVYLALNLADSVYLWALLMSANGAAGSLFRVGADAMVADLIAPERRAEAYALTRTSHNVGVAIGPAIGGFLAAASYSLALWAAAAAYAAFGLLVLLRVAESLPATQENQEATSENGGYSHLLRDRSFLLFCAITTLAILPASLIFILLPVYAKEQFGLPESMYGFLVTVNAGMVVLLQYAITKQTERFAPMLMMAVGALLYALGVGSVALAQGFAALLVSMVILTLGEMVMVPTGTTQVANQSPSDMRGRYMGVYGLTWMVGFGIGPVLGGLLSDYIAPVATWHGGLILGLAATGGFLLLGWRLRHRHSP
jgi:MFS family permease